MITNNEQSPTLPNLQATSIADSRSGNLLGAEHERRHDHLRPGRSSSGGFCTIVTGHVVTAADLPGPITNSVTVNANPAGFPNLISATANDSVIIQINPAYTLTKECGPARRASVT